MTAEDNLFIEESDELQLLRNRLKIESSDSLKLLMSPEDNPICRLFYDALIPGLVVVWKQYATSAQLRFIHEHMLALLKKHHVQKILGDDTELVTIHAEDLVWLTQNWMPRAVTCGFRAGASKNPEAYFGKLSVTDVRTAAPHELVIRSFECLGEARQWLQGFPTA